ncbi:MAG: hypothetical protein HC905_12285 [Bacteroidales bacterium]|nr:hypothetical protein [Bacteroidales bacterium]
MPNVKAGSVIEIKYTIQSDFLMNLREWQFQYTIPVLKSSYYVAIPEYFYYNKTSKGYYSIKNEEDMRTRNLKITYIQRAEGTSVREQTYEQEFKYTEKVFRFDAENVPAFPMEKYLTTADNYLSKVEFELSYTKMPNSAVREYTSTWEAISQRLQEDDEFGLAIKKSGHFKEEAQRIKNSGASQYAQTAMAFNLIKEK